MATNGFLNYFSDGTSLLSKCFKVLRSAFENTIGFNEIMQICKTFVGSAKKKFLITFLAN
jgi:hypothetical protein